MTISTTTLVNRTTTLHTLSRDVRGRCGDVGGQQSVGAGGAEVHEADCGVQKHNLEARGALGDRKSGVFQRVELLALHEQVLGGVIGIVGEIHAG